MHPNIKKRVFVLIDSEALPTCTHALLSWVWHYSTANLNNLNIFQFSQSLSEDTTPNPHSSYLCS